MEISSVALSPYNASAIDVWTLVLVILNQSSKIKNIAEKSHQQMNIYIDIYTGKAVS